MIILTHEILELVTDNNAFIVLVKSIAKRASYKDQSCFPSLATMEKDTGMSRNTVITACKWLKENGLIQVIQRQNEKGGNTSNYYVIETDLIKIIGKLKSETPVQNLNPPSSEFEPPLVQNLNTNHKPTLTTSTINKKEKKFNAETYILDLQIDLDVKNKIIDWLEIRKAKKTPTTEKSISLALALLNKNSKQNQIKILETSILNGWVGIFPLKENGFNNQTQPTTNNYNQVSKFQALEETREAFDKRIDILEEERGERFKRVYTEPNKPLPFPKPEFRNI